MASNPDRLGQIAYEAWCSHTSSPLSLWESLPQNVRDAWNAVGQAVLLSIGQKSGLIAENDDNP